MIIIIIIIIIPLSLCTEHRALTVPHHPRLLFQFLGSIRHLVGLLGGRISPVQGLYLHRTTQHRKMQMSMAQARFEPAIPMFKWLKTVLALDCLAIETSQKWINHNTNLIKCYTYIMFLCLSLLIEQNLRKTKCRVGYLN
jgi:hypothetical protein